MKKRSRSASAKKRTAKKRPARKTSKPRSTATSRRRTGVKTRTRAGAKKTTARKPVRKIRAAKPAAARKRTATTRAPAPSRVATRVSPAPKPAAPPAPVVPANELKVGVVTHYYSHLSVAVVSVTDRPLRIGDRIHIKGHTSDFYQTVESMQIEHNAINAAEVGQTVGLKVTEHAREHDTVYLVT